MKTGDTMKALVIGGTGIIGNHVVRSLLDEGIDVRVFQRGKTPALNLEGLKVERVQGDLADPDSLAKAVKGCDWVFHTAPYYPTHTFDAQGHRQRALQGMKTVLDVCAAQSISRFVYTSSMTTIGFSNQPGHLASEKDPYNLIDNPPHPYFDVKYRMEEVVKDRARSGFPAIIVNPTGCFGPYELKPQNLCLVPQLVNRKIPAYVERPTNVVNVADVGRGHVLAAKKGKIGERYLLGGSNVTTGWLLQQICEVAGVKPPQLKLPMSVALIPAWVSEGISYGLHQVPSIPILGLRFIQYGQHFDLTKARNELGFEPTSLHSAFEKAIEWFKKVGYC
jgi:dihydroflavonol-4-reductase